MARKKKKVPEINASSMADISFLLLIFFLVTTTMDTDSGLTRRLPPLADTNEEAKVKEKNILNVMINNQDVLMVNRKRCDVSELKELTKQFITPDPGNDKSPELEDKEFSDIGMVKISKGVVSLKNSRGTSYRIYISVQNELTKAFNERREELSKLYYNKSYAELSKDQSDVINTIVPMRISEAEPDDTNQ